MLIKAALLTEQILYLTSQAKTSIFKTHESIFK